MNKWTHSICDDCWPVHDGRSDPIRVSHDYRVEEKCCWCGRWNKDGVYKRMDPLDVPCRGLHAGEN